MCSSDYKVNVPYGVIDSDDSFRLKNIDEKPEKKYPINAGIYILSPDVLEGLERQKHIDMTTVIDNQIYSNKKVGVYQLDDYWLDIGKMEDYHRAHQEYFSHF